MEKKVYEVPLPCLAHEKGSLGRSGLEMMMNKREIKKKQYNNTWKIKFMGLRLDTQQLMMGLLTLQQHSIQYQRR
ncbi:CLUMA_CG004224, isoform A [Clunio marinus]|uniref:CLUMA_CG004224, isoform A n=1 Tax=Clunio marinus TaxID=568069 RepID=A0A1J1HWI5_9DIPT|nr:CLUMA_CG004224, isoform A [Clunio marinus]